MTHPASNSSVKALNNYFIIIVISLFILITPKFINAQCPLVIAACSGTSVSGASNQTIPSGTTYYIASGNTLSGNVTFTDNTSILCIEGTWTGRVTVATAAGIINVYGTINSAASWVGFNGGTGVFNVYPGAHVTIPGQFSVSGGTYTIINCGEEFNFGTHLNISGGTVVIDNYSSMNITGNLVNNNANFTLTNKTDSHMYIGGSVSWSAGTFNSSGDLCVTGSSAFSGGSLTSGSCYRTASLDISGSNAFTNNYSVYMSGSMSNSGTGTINNGNMTIAGSLSNTGILTNNGTIAVTANVSNNSTGWNYGAGSLLTCVDWTSSSSSNTGPASGCAQVRATGATSLSGTFTAGNSSRVYFYDSGLPAAGFDTYSGTKNSININSNACTPTVYPTCANAGTACAATLPITLTEFRAECKNGKVDLVWSTASETNNDYFTIERSKDVTTYEPVGTIDSKAPGGNSIKTLSYSFIDNSFPKEEAANLNKIFYYRLKQTDFDGKFTYSFISSASCSDYCMSDITVTSDNNTVTFNIQSICSTFVDFSIYNALGQIVSTKRVFIETGYNNIKMDANTVAQGLYIIKASSQNQTIQKKFGKQQ